MFPQFLPLPSSDLVYPFLPSPLPPPFLNTPDLCPVVPSRAPNSDFRMKNQAAPPKDFLKDKDKVERSGVAEAGGENRGERAA